MDLKFLRQIKEIIIKSKTPIKGSDIANMFPNTAPSKVYQYIRLIVEGGTAIYPDHEGFIYARFASKKQGIKFMRKMANRRAYISRYLRPAIPYLKKQWPNGELDLSLNILYDPNDAGRIAEISDSLFGLMDTFDKDKKKS